MLSNTIKQKRKEKAGKWEVPLPKVSTPLGVPTRGAGRLGPRAPIGAGGEWRTLRLSPGRRSALWQRTRCSRC